MNQDLDTLCRIRELTSNEFERFKAAISTLISKTFIIRGIEKERELYDFTLRNLPLFQAWFFCMDASLEWDENLGVIAYRGSGKMRIHFSREEICAVLTLRLLYEDKKREVSLTMFPVVSLRDFKDKYKAQTGIKELKKTSLTTILRRLSSCKLIDFPSQDPTDDEAVLLLYPSIPFSINRQALDEALAFLRSREGNKEEQEDPGEEDA
jgi:hypothetical protein